MAEIVSYQCPNCEAPLSFDPEKGAFHCEYCLSTYSEADLLAIDAQRKKDEAREKVAASEADDYCAQMEEYACPNCGAVVACEGNTVATECVYCHTPVIHRGKLSGQMRPHKLVPFAFNREAAEESFRKFVSKHKFVPRDFFSTAQLEKMQGIYFPFWVTDADTRAGMTAHGTKVRTWRAGDYRYTETSHFHVVREGEIHFEDLTTCALSEADKAMLEGILPFPSEALIDFSMPYLAGFLTKKRDIEKDALHEEAENRMRGYSDKLLSDTIHGYATLAVENRGMVVYRENWDYALMPVWLMTYRGKKRNYTYAMNGNTGKVYGELPISAGKLWALFGGICAAVAAVVGLIGGLLL
ncbi:MAG: hypothetical protein ACI4SP_00250 [Eubacteriales bacterium]